MSSIGNTLNSLNTSLLAEISAFSTSKTAGAGAAVQSNIGNPGDKIDFSKATQVFRELHKLQAENPAEFKQVLTDAASKLNDAAQQQTDPSQAEVLSNLADRFQQAANSGDLSALQQSPDSNGSYSSQGHHHHHGGGHPPPVADSQTQDLLSSILAPTQTSQTANPLNDALSSLFDIGVGSGF